MNSNQKMIQKYRILARCCGDLSFNKNPRYGCQVCTCCILQALWNRAFKCVVK